MNFTYEGHDFILHGDAQERVKRLPDNSVNCIVTSPPYYGLRDYGVTGQIGLEESPEAYIEKLVNLFRECRRVLAKNGTFWLNLGDSYAANRGYQVPDNMHVDVGNSLAMKVPNGLKPKDLMMIPARVALALQADGWYLRSQIIWHKPNCMPESVKDRPTNDYELVYLLSKSPEYFYDADAIKEAAHYDGRKDTMHKGSAKYSEGLVPNAKPHTLAASGHERWQRGPSGEFVRNARAVWSVNTKPYSEAHFATMPQELADKCIKAGCPKGGVVLDPFGGAGTTAVSAISLKRHYILIELNPAYISLAQKRIRIAEIEASQLDMFEAVQA